MNIRINPKVLSVMLIVTSFWFLSARVGNGSADPFLDGQMKRVESKIGHWERSSHIIACLTYAVTVLGAIVALSQRSTNKWIRGGAAFLAVVSALILPINRQFFSADDRAYQKVAKQARNKLDEFDYQLGQFSSLNEETKGALRTRFQGLLAEVDQLEYNTIYNVTVTGSASSALSGMLLPSAWADQNPEGIREPAWVKNPPSDERNLYFLGTADGRTFEEAHERALSSARTFAATLFAGDAQASAQLAAKPQLVTQLGTALSNAAEVADTFTAPNPAGGYRAFALLRLSRTAALFAAQSIFVEAGVPYDKAFLDKVQKDSKD
jgi:hypothetical protein